MPMYAFKGVSSNGKAVAGVRDADSPKALRANLRKDGVSVMSFELSRGGKQAKEANSKKGGLSRDVDLGGFGHAWLPDGHHKSCINHANSQRAAKSLNFRKAPSRQTCIRKQQACAMHKY